MAYRIVYDKEGGRFEVRKEFPLRFPLLLCGAAALFLLLTVSFWPRGGEYLWDALIPGDNQTTVQAVTILISDLRGGASLGDAVESFCRLVIHGPQN